jgi:hypothetical protein
MWQASEGLIAILATVFALGSIRALMGVRSSIRKKTKELEDAVRQNRPSPPQSDGQINATVGISASGNNQSPFPRTKTNDQAANLAAKGI